MILCYIRSITPYILIISSHIVIPTYIKSRVVACDNYETEYLSSKTTIPENKPKQLCN